MSCGNLLISASMILFFFAPCLSFSLLVCLPWLGCSCKSTLSLCADKCWSVTAIFIIINGIIIVVFKINAQEIYLLFFSFTSFIQRNSQFCKWFGLSVEYSVTNVIHFGWHAWRTDIYASLAPFKCHIIWRIGDYPKTVSLNASWLCVVQALSMPPRHLARLHGQENVRLRIRGKLFTKCGVCRFVCAAQENAPRTGIVATYTCGATCNKIIQLWRRAYFRCISGFESTGRRKEHRIHSNPKHQTNVIGETVQCAACTVQCAHISIANVSSTLNFNLTASHSHNKFYTNLLVFDTIHLGMSTFIFILITHTFYVIGFSNLNFIFSGGKIQLLKILLWQKGLVPIRCLYVLGT